MIRKLYNLIPVVLQKRLKLKYYNFKIKGFSFSLNKEIYCSTDNKSWKIFTKTALYFIVKDVNRYERYYKVLEGDVIIDAGANEGILSLIYSKKVKTSGQVLAFEPDSVNIKTFNENLNLNKNIANISLSEKGLWNKTGIIEFYEAGTVGSSIYYEGNNAIKREIEVISIDEFIKQKKILRLDFIKMDIEGAEIEALQGATETIKLLRPHFAIASYHIIKSEHTYLRLESFFKEIGFPYKTIFYEDGEIITYAGDNVLKENVM